MSLYFQEIISLDICAVCIHYWGEPERAPPSLYNEEISVCLSARTFKRQKICVGRPGKFWGALAIRMRIKLFARGTRLSKAYRRTLIAMNGQERLRRRREHERRRRAEETAKQREARLGLRRRRESDRALRLQRQSSQCC